MNKKYWKWNSYRFNTLKQAKNCIEGDFNGEIAKLLEYDGYDRIWYIEKSKPISYVKISIDNNGYAIFSKIVKL